MVQEKYPVDTREFAVFSFLTNNESSEVIVYSRLKKRFSHIRQFGNASSLYLFLQKIKIPTPGNNHSITKVINTNVLNKVT